MRPYRSIGLGYGLVIAAAIALVGCTTPSSSRDSGGGTDASTNGAEPGQELPTGACAENDPPGGQVVFPPENVSVAAGEIAFLWLATDADGEEVDSTVYVSDQPAVFDNPLLTQGVIGVIGDEEAAQQRTSFQLTQTGRFYWGVEISDQCGATVRRPVDGDGVPFRVTLSGRGRLDASDVILLCPRDSQAARRTTTFLWSLGDTVPQRTKVFVSRADEPNPFQSPLRVLEVTPPTASFRALSAAEALPADQELSWGLRIETPDQVLFTFEGQLGQSFVATENVPPSGELLGPADGAVLADNTPRFDVRWQADPGNCEDPLTSTVYFERLEGAEAPQSLFDSPIRVEVEAGTLELDLVSRVAELDLVAGVWAWGVLADDGTDAASLSARPAGSNYQTFLRNTSPEFVAPPTVGWRACDPLAALLDTTDFAYADANGPDTVAITLYYAPDRSAVFDESSATQTLAAGEIAGTPQDAFFVVVQESETGCPVFARGTGFYGVELNDGVNDPVRRIVEYAGPDRNGNGVPDADDITAGTSEDCNGYDIPDESDVSAGLSPDCNDNGVPDECELAGNDCNGNAVPDDCELAEADANGNGIIDECEPPPPPPPFPDCNGNGVPDDQDIANETSTDCNLDGIPDECQGSPLVDAGTLRTGVIVNGTYNSWENESDTNHLSGIICNVEGDILPEWIVESQPSGSEVFFEDQFSPWTPYWMQPAVPGTYVFRLTETLSGATDTVSLTLVLPQ